MYKKNVHFDEYFCTIMLCRVNYNGLKYCNSVREKYILRTSMYTKQILFELTYHDEVHVSLYIIFISLNLE